MLCYNIISELVSRAFSTIPIVYLSIFLNYMIFEQVSVVDIIYIKAHYPVVLYYTLFSNINVIKHKVLFKVEQ